MEVHQQMAMLWHDCCGALTLILTGNAQSVPDTPEAQQHSLLCALSSGNYIVKSCGTGISESEGTHNCTVF